jgi:hypothetical protein
LRKYGYLESLDSNSSETLYSEETIFDAIKLMQRYGAVPETGRLDNETLQARLFIDNLIEIMSRTVSNNNENNMNFISFFNFCIIL